MEGQQRQNNWFPLRRETLENPIFKDCVALSVFIDISKKAAFAETEFLGISLNPGQLVISVRHEAEKIGIERNKFRRALITMKSAKIIDFEKITKVISKRANNLSQQMSQQMSHKITLITIYDLVSYYKSVTNGLSQQMSQQMSQQFEPYNNNICNITTNENNKEGYKSNGGTVGETPTTPAKAENLNKSAFVEWWNREKRMAKSKIPGITTKAPLSEKRAKAIRAIIQTYGKSTMADVIRFAFKDDFYNGRLNGNGHGNWVADVDFIFKPSNFEKALERMENKGCNQNNEGGTAPTTPPNDSNQPKGGNGGTLDDLSNFYKYFNY